jgi:hypothetical protein
MVRLVLAYDSCARHRRNGAEMEAMRSEFCSSEESERTQAGR